MAYIGESIPITIEGNDKINLDELPWELVVYNPYKTTEHYMVEKDDASFTSPNVYGIVIPDTETVKWTEGDFIIEVKTITPIGAKITQARKKLKFKPTYYGG